MVMLAHLLVQNEAWRDRPMRLLRVVANESAREETERHLMELLTTARIKAAVEVIVDTDPVEAIHRASENASVTFLGFALPDEDQEPKAFLDRSEDLLSGLGTVFLVHSTGDVLLEA